MKNLKFITINAFIILFFLINACSQDRNWTGWRGANRDAKVVGFKSPSSWPEELTKLWQVETGIGDGSVLFINGNIFTHVKQDSSEVALCLNSENGEILWRTVLNKAPKITGGPARNPGTRSTPAFYKERLFLLGAGGILSCVEAKTGEPIWQEKQYSEVPPFFVSASPLIADNKCIAHLGGHENGKIVAFNIENGDEIWSIDKPSTYSSPVTMVIEGTEIIVLQTAKELIGISLEGKILWSIDTPTIQRHYNSTTPVVFGENIILTGQGKGFRSFKVEKKSGEYALIENWNNEELNVNYNTPVFKDGYLFAHDAQRGKLFCLDAIQGNTCWKDSIPYHRFTTTLDLGEVLLSLSAEGDMLIFNPNHTLYSEVAKYKITKDLSLAYPVIVGDKIYVKEKEKVSCWSIE